jgi:hypothetical protein
MPSSHAILEFRFGPDAPMARRLPGLSLTNLLQGKKAPSLCHFNPSQRRKVVVSMFFYLFSDCY